MNLKKLCERISLQKEIVDQIDVFLENYDIASLDPLIEELRMQDTSADAQLKLERLFSAAAPANIPLLTCQLIAAVRNYERFREMAISDEIYFDTMSAFTRFCEETHKYSGNWYYNHASWSYRQASMLLFRIGILEYEFKNRDGEPMISIHIPSDTVFSESNLDETFKAAKRFIAKFYPEHSNDRFYCESWIMAPKLRELLPETSGIIRFQNRFASIEESLPPDCCLKWVFHCSDETPLGELPEDTSLQRKIKKLMIAGGHLYGGFGVL